MIDEKHLDSFIKAAKYLQVNGILEDDDIIKHNQSLFEKNSTDVLSQKQTCNLKRISEETKNKSREKIIKLDTNESLNSELFCLDSFTNSNDEISDVISMEKNKMEDYTIETHDLVTNETKCNYTEEPKLGI